MMRNRSGAEFAGMAAQCRSSADPHPEIVSTVSLPANSELETDMTDGPRVPPRRLPSAVLAVNFLLAAAAGTIWYFQFFFYSMGQTQMGRYDFSSWTLHMASIIIFSTIWGMLIREWRGTSLGTRMLVFVGLLLLVTSTLAVGYGNYLQPDNFSRAGTYPGSASSGPGFRIDVAFDEEMPSNSGLPKIFRPDAEYILAYCLGSI
jgi:hypothetical protein